MFKKILSIIFAVSVCFPTLSHAFDLRFIGENHQTPECKVNRKNLIQLAIDQKTHLSLEGLVYGDQSFNQDILKNAADGGFALNAQTPIYGIEEKQLLALSGLYFSLIGVENAKSDYLQRMQNADFRMFHYLNQLGVLITQYPTLADYYYGTNMKPTDIRADLKALLDQMIQKDHIDMEKAEPFAQKMMDVTAQYRKSLDEKKLYIPDQNKLEKIRQNAWQNDLKSEFAVEGYYYTYFARNVVIVDSLTKTIMELQKSGVTELNVLIGRRHVMTIFDKMSNPEIQKQTGELNLLISDLCY